MRRELVSNDLRGVTASGIDSVTTSLPLESATAFPSEGDYRIVVDNEIMLVTGKSGNNLTVIRGQEGTAATAHNASVSVLQIVTTLGLKRLIKEHSDPWAESANRPPFRCMDGNGDLLDHNDFTTVGLFTGGTISSEGNGGPITIRQSAQVTEYLAAGVRSAPSTPYEIIMCLDFTYIGTTVTAGPIMGALFRESGTSKLIVTRWRPNDVINQKLRVSYYTDPATYNSGLSAWKALDVFGNRHWYKLSDDGVDISFYISADGVNWSLIYTEGRGVSFTTAPDQVGFYTDAISSAGVATYAALLSWTGE